MIGPDTINNVESAKVCFKGTQSQKKGKWSDMYVCDDLQGFVKGCEEAGSRSAFLAINLSL